MDGNNVIQTDRFKRLQGAFLRIGDKVYPVYKGINTVGRNKLATINIKHLNVSQNQAIIVLVDDQQHFISDVNSSNGTFLHDAELVPFKLYEIANNSKITFGDIIGTYFKLPNDGTSPNLTEAAEMTQDITQNFYAANTQLIFDQTVANQSNEHSYFNPIQKACLLPSVIPDDIHELNTQVVEYIPQNNQRVEQNSNELLIQTENLEECVIEEPVDTDIHDAPTQVIAFSKPNESSHAVIKIHCEKVSVEDIQVITGFKELQVDSEKETTQVIKDVNNLETSQKSLSDETTQILNEDETQKAIDLINTSIQKNVQDVQQKSHVLDSFDIGTSLKLGSGEATQIVNEEETPKAIELNNTDLQKANQDKQRKKIVLHSSQTSCSSGLNRKTTFENDSMLDTSKRISTLHEDIEDTFIDGSMSNDSVDFLTMPTHNDDVKENISGNESGNESPTSLGNKGNVEGPNSNKFSHDSSSSDMFHRLKKPIPKLPSDKSSTTDQEDKISSDSDTDIENSKDIGRKKTQPKNLNFDDANTNMSKSIKGIGIRKKPLRTLNSDSDTDIDDTQCIAYRKKPLQKLTSDEDVPQPKILEHVSDSDTDCEDIKADGSKNQPVKENKQLDIDSGSDTDIEVEKQTSTTQKDDGDLNDTDCIPATQDAFAEAFDYKAQRMQNSCNHSSEESFKLGITELLEDSVDTKTDVEVNREKQADEVEEIDDKNGELNDDMNGEICMDMNEVSKKQRNKSDEDNDDGIFGGTNEERKVSEDEVKDDNIYILPTQKIKDQVEKPKHIVEDHRSEQMEEETPNVVRDDDDVYLLATQKLNSQTDVFTDFKAPSRIFTFRKKAANLEDSLTTILSNNKKDEEDIYLMATQKFNERESSGVDKNDDVYLQATQKLEVAQEKKAYDVFSQPTQCLNVENQFKHVQSKEDDEDIYDAATQQMGINLLKKANTKEVEPVLSRDQKDAYMQDTQKIQEHVQDVNEANSAQDDSANPSSSLKDGYNLEPQTDDTLSEIPFTDDNVQLVVTPSYNRPQNPLIQVLNDQAISEEEEKPSNSSAKRNRNIQEDIQESPSKKIKSVHTEHLLDRISSRKNDVETLSEIEDFIKKPLDIVPLSRKTTKRKEQVVREESAVQQDVETLSQIEDFIKKPLDIVPLSRKTTKRKEQVVREESAVQQDVETLSQIEAFIKKPLEVPKYRKSMRTEKNQVIEEKPDTSETLSQIEAFVKQPLQKVEGKEKKEEPIKVIRKSERRRSNSDSSTSSVTDHEPKDDQRVSRRLSKRRVSNTQEETIAAINKDKLNVIEEYNEADDFEDPSERFSRTKHNEKTQSRVIDYDENPEKSHSFEDSSRYLEVKSDVDQSFALLESKCSKVRRQPCKDPVLNEIKVSVTSHRRSVSTAETSKKSSAEILFPSRKSSRRTTVNNNIISATSSKKKRKVETIVNDKKEVVDDSSSEFSDSEIPAKISKKSSKEDKRTRGEYSVGEDSLRTQKPSSSKRISRSIKSIKESDNNNHTSTKSDKPSTSNVSEMNSKASKSSKKLGNAKIASTSEENVTINKVPTDNENDHPLISRGTKPSTSSDSSEPTSKNSRKPTRITNSKTQSTSEERHFVKDSTTPLKLKMKRAKENESTSSESITTPRRGQSSVANETLLSSAERSRRKQKPKVVFTMLESPQLESFIKHLGGSIVDKVDSATVLVTEHVKRSQKLLTAVAQGKPICSPKWIHASKRVNEFVDPWDYILIDEEAETRWDFSLKESLLRAANNKLLVKYTFQLMVANAADVLKGAIEASGGKCVTRNPGKNVEDTFIIVASPEHKTKYTKVKKQNPNITIIEPEAIFDGVLRQELRFSRHLVS